MTATQWIGAGCGFAALVWLIDYLACLYYQHTNKDDLEDEDYGC